MVVQSSSMATKLGKDEDVEVELELCLSLGGPSKKTRKKREAKQQQRSGGEGECKRIRMECNGVPNGVDLDLSFSKMGSGYGYGYGSGQFKDTSRGVTIGSPVSNSSSDVSDPSSSSRQEGESLDFGENPGNTKPVNSIQTGTEETVQSTDGSNDAVVVETQEWSNSVAKDVGKPPRPRPNGNGNGNGNGANGNGNGNGANGSLLPPFAQMPCVTSTGNGPEGKTVNGFLYRYSKSEISIVCVCHGTSFSPAEFIIHAGGTHVLHPLRHITVVPSTF